MFSLPARRGFHLQRNIKYFSLPVMAAENKIYPFDIVVLACLLDANDISPIHHLLHELEKIRFGCKTDAVGVYLRNKRLLDNPDYFLLQIIIFNINLYDPAGSFVIAPAGKKLKQIEVQTEIIPEFWGDFNLYAVFFGINAS